MSSFERVQNAKSKNIHPLKRAAAAVVLLGVLISGACSNEQDSSAPNQTTTSIDKELTLENAKNLQWDATVQLRKKARNTQGKGGAPEGATERDLDYMATQASCSATYIGNGNFTTSAHCFNDEIHQGGGLYAAVYDAYDEMTNDYEIWAGNTPETVERIADVDGIVINGDFTVNDFALVHTDEKIDLPKLEVTDQNVFDFNKHNYQGQIAGYPAFGNFSKYQSQISYIGMTSGQAIDDGHGLGENYDPMPVYGTLKNADSHAAIQCTPGDSGGSVINRQAEIGGVLARLGRPEDTLGIDMGLTEDNLLFQNLCLFQPVNTNLVSEYESQIGQPAPQGSFTISK